MRFVFPLLALLALQCAPVASDATTPDATTPDGQTPVGDVAPPSVAVLGGLDGGRLLVTFRGPTAVPLSPTAGARLDTPRGTVEAEAMGPPAESREGDVVVVSGSYALAGPDVPTANLAGRDATLTLTVGGERRTFPVVRDDVLE